MQRRNPSLCRPKPRWHSVFTLLLITNPANAESSPLATANIHAADQAQTLSPNRWGALPTATIESSSFDTDFGLLRRDTDDAATTFPRRLIMMGAPASGKGTQCQAIAERHALVHLSTGEMLRQAVASESVDHERDPHIRSIKSCMEQGKLIPDEIVVRLVLERLRSPDCKRQGWILDGFPRTRNQAMALQNAGIHPDKFVFLDVPDEVAIKRIVGRRQDPLTGKVYHLDWNLPTSDQIRDRLVVRSDDTAESMKRRLEQFRKNANAVKGCYDNIVEVGGLGTPDEVFREIDFSLKLASKCSSSKLTVDKQKRASMRNALQPSQPM